MLLLLLLIAIFPFFSRPLNFVYSIYCTNSVVSERLFFWFWRMVWAFPNAAAVIVVVAFTVVASVPSQFSYRISLFRPWPVPSGFPPCKSTCRSRCSTSPSRSGWPRWSRATGGGTRTRTCPPKRRAATATGILKRGEIHSLIMLHVRYVPPRRISPRRSPASGTPPPGTPERRTSRRSCPPAGCG